MSHTNVVRVSGFNSLADDLDAAVESFLATCRSRQLSDCTAKYYSYRLQAFRRFLSGKEYSSAPKDITPQIVREFLTDEGSRNSATTASHSFTTLSAFFAYLVDDGFTTSNPMESVDKPQRKKTMINTFSLEQVDRIVELCGKDFIGVRDKAMILMLVDCGLRASELSELEISDVDWAENTLMVLGKGNKERLVPFGHNTHQALTAYLARRGELDTQALFVSTLSARLNRFRVREIIIQRCTAAGITGVRCSPHTFRHTMAVTYLRNGGDVFSLQKLLGHSSLDMTRKYAELSQTDVQDKHRLYSPADRLQSAKQTKGRKRLR